jgi:hypothetical protein
MAREGQPAAAVNCGRTIPLVAQINVTATMMQALQQVTARKPGSLAKAVAASKRIDPLLCTPQHTHRSNQHSPAAATLAAGKRQQGLVCTYIAAQMLQRASVK